MPQNLIEIRPPVPEPMGYAHGNASLRWAMSSNEGAQTMRPPVTLKSTSAQDQNAVAPIRHLRRLIHGFAGVRGPRLGTELWIAMVCNPIPFQQRAERLRRIQKEVKCLIIARPDPRAGVRIGR